VFFFFFFFFLNLMRRKREALNQVHKNRENDDEKIRNPSITPLQTQQTIKRNLKQQNE